MTVVNGSNQAYNQLFIDSSHVSGPSVLDKVDELEQLIQHIWSIPPTTKVKQSSQKYSDIYLDHMLLHLQMKACIGETKDYFVLLSFEEYESLVHSNTKLENEIEMTQSKLSVFKIIQKASIHLLEEEDLLLSVTDTVHELTSLLDKLESQQAKTQLRLLQHTTGALCLGIQASEEDMELIENQVLYQQRVYQDLSQEYTELKDLMTTVSDVDFKLKFLQSQVEWLQLRDDTLRSELDMYRHQVGELRVQKEQGQSLARLQTEFSEKEEHWMKNSELLEAQVEGILKEVHHLTDVVTEFQSDKDVYEKRIKELSSQIKELELAVADRYEETDDSLTATAILRKEFKEIIRDIQETHRTEMKSLLQEKKRLERDVKHERALQRYDRMNQGVQTLFIP